MLFSFTLAEFSEARAIYLAAFQVKKHKITAGGGLVAKVAEEAWNMMAAALWPVGGRGVATFMVSVGLWKKHLLSPSKGGGELRARMITEPLEARKGW